MPTLIKDLYSSTSGPVQNDKNWWRLIFDTSSKSFLVEHEWAHLDVHQEKPTPDNGRDKMTVDAFMQSKQPQAAKEALERLIARMFDD